MLVNFCGFKCAYDSSKVKVKNFRNLGCQVLRVGKTNVMMILWGGNIVCLVKYEIVVLEA